MTTLDLFSLVGKLPWLTLWMATMVAAASILIFAPLARRVGWVDKPSARKSHEGEIPLIGGWAIVIALIVLQIYGPLSAMAPPGYWVGAIFLFVVSLVDDRHPIRARYRFMVQIGAAVAGVSMGGQMLLSVGDLFGVGSLNGLWIVLPVSIVGTVAVVNAVNFSDGADGLCGGLGIIAFFWFLVLAWMAHAHATALGFAAASHASSLVPIAAAMMGGLAGFLIFNLRAPWRKRASVFLGDSGSMLLGFTLAWVAIHITSAYGEASPSPVACLWIMAVPLFDSASCIVRRLFEGVTPMTADQKHLHHLLRQVSGLSVGRAVLVIHAAALCCGFIGVVGWLQGIPERVMFFGFVMSLLVFVAVTNLAWRRMESKSATTQLISQ